MSPDSGIRKIRGARGGFSATPPRTIRRGIISWSPVRGITANGSAIRARSLGPLTFGGHETSREFRENIEAPFFRYYLHGKGDKLPGRRARFNPAPTPGINTMPGRRSKPRLATCICMPTGRFPSMRRQRAHGIRAVRFRSSEPGALSASGPSRRPIHAATGPPGKSADQRFVDHRPDVLSFVSAPLDSDLVVTGQLAAELFASTSGTDSDFVVKLIDVFPGRRGERRVDRRKRDRPPGDYGKSLNGYELPIAMEVRRGRYNQSYEHPAPLIAGKPTQFTIPLRDHDHVFQKGHRIMVQVQSTWFPLIDRNPQKFVPSIFTAKASDFISATQRVYCSPRLPSHIVLSVMP